MMMVRFIQYLEMLSFVPFAFIQTLFSISRLMCMTQQQWKKERDDEKQRCKSVENNKTKQIYHSDGW